MHHLKAVLILTLLFITVACGGKPTPTSNPPTGKQLDPQGNWLFTVTGSGGDAANTLTWGEELFEIAPPTVTSNTGIGWYGNPWQYLNGAGTVSATTGSVSGTSTANFVITLVDQKQSPTITLTGTIANDQQHISGTWTAEPGLQGALGQQGTWTAQLITPITGSYSGTLNQVGSPNTISVTMSMNEDTSQTDTTMGQVTGSLNITGSPCFSPTDTLTFASLNSVHIGEWANLFTLPDSSGQSVTIIPNPDGIDPNTATITVPDGSQIGNFEGFRINGGSCDGQMFTGTLVKQ